MFGTRRLLGVVVALALSSAAQAEEGHGAHHAAAGGSPATVAYQAAMQRMHTDMDIPYTGDADRDFAAGMIPHHQGAVAMAEIQLKYGKDPALHRLAKSIIVSQKKEIRFMEQWHATHGGAVK